MSSELRVVQFMELIVFTGNIATNPAKFKSLKDIEKNVDKTLYDRYRFQNYFCNQTKKFLDKKYDFAPFSSEGISASLGGDNELFQILIPNTDVGVKLLERGNANRLSRLRLHTVFMDATLNPENGPRYEEFYVGVGSSINETTIELRFRSAVDTVLGKFPRRTLDYRHVGKLPVSAEVRT